MSDLLKKIKGNLVGHTIVIIQAFISFAFGVMAWETKLLPTKYLIVIIVLLLLFVLIFEAMQFAKRKTRIVGMVLSVLVSIVLLIGAVYVEKAKALMNDIGGATFKTDNMIVVVRIDDSAENIMDAKDYRFGVQNSVDQENTALMVEDIESTVGKAIKKVEYPTITDMAQALLDEEVRAAVYNEAFIEVIEETIEGYSEQIKIIHMYGIETELEVEEVDLEKPFNVYISGIDVSGPITTSSRSDVNIIMTVNPSTHHILLTTTPRDYYVQIPNISGEQKDKLTHAGIYGVDASMNTLESLYGIDISYYARVNFTSLIKIVDALGGVDVYSAYAFNTGAYSFKQGMNHMDGEKALAFSRERYSLEGGDNQRGKNQEAVIEGIIDKAMSPAILTNASEIIAGVADSVETNMTREEMAKLISMQLEKPVGWYIESVAASGTGDSQACYSSGSQLLYVMHPDENSVNQIKAKMQGVLQEEAMRQTN